MLIFKRFAIGISISYLGCNQQILNMNNRTIAGIVFVILITSFGSCDKGATDAVLNFKAIKSDLNQKKSIQISEYEVDSMSMIIEAISIEKTIPDEAYNFESIEDSIAYWESMDIYSKSIYGPYIINLIRGTSEPGIDIGDIDPGYYNCIDVNILNGVGDSISFYLLGKALINEEEIAFECKYSGHASIEFTNRDGFEIAENELNHIWVLTDINSLLSSLDLSSATIDQDRVIRINRESNKELVGIIIENLQSSSSIKLDWDMDG